MEILLPCNLEQLNERILNLGVGIAQMSEQDSIRVHKSFLVSVLGYMEELLAVRNKIAAGEYKPVIHAHWKIVNDFVDIGDGKHAECSNCGYEVDPYSITKGCPNCRALMDGKDDSHAS